jgi:hypothetical protein
MKNITILLSLLLFSGYSLSQVNVEKFRGKNSINFLLSYSHAETTTNDTNTLFFNLLANKVIGKNEYLAVGGSTVSEKNGEDFKDNQFMHLRFFRNLDNWGPELFFQYAKNSFSNQRKRKLVGLGVRKIINKETFSLRGGLSIVAENLTLESEVDGLKVLDEMDLTRANLYVNFTQNIFSVTAYYQPNTDNFGEFNMSLESMLTFKLWKDRLKLDIIYNITKNNELDVKNSLFMQVFRWKI